MRPLIILSRAREGITCIVRRVSFRLAPQKPSIKMAMIKIPAGKTTMHQSVTIDRQFNGPPKSANGGYASGVLAAGLVQAGYKGAVEASLHAPPPLDHAMQLGATVDSALLSDGDTKVGTAKAATLSLEVPSLPSAPKFVGAPKIGKDAFRPFDQCFVCGGARHAGDGLCIAAEVVEDEDDLMGTRWQLHPNFADEKGEIDPAYIWSALDCPGYFACAYGEAALLGRLTAEIFKPLKMGGDATVYGWSLDDPSAPKSRKRRCGTAVIDASGELVAKAEGLWITIDPARLAG